MNSFYASVECLYNPSIRDKPVVVGGKEENRHGIVLAANPIAKRYGIKTGNALWEARAHCADLVVVHPHYDKYLQYSKFANEIYAQYSDRIEGFGLDESWIEITGCTGLYGSGEKVANEIRKRIYKELGVTVSVGVSFNKIFSKLGSDMQKPDATTIITKENYKEKVWPLPVGDLLYVGRKTEKKLRNYGVTTIGDLANYDRDRIKVHLGKIGVMLWGFANGMDISRVEAADVIKSVGNSTTAPRDLVTEDDIKITVYLLAESVTARLRDYGFTCSTVQVHIRDKSLSSYERQMSLPFPCADSNAIARAALTLIKRNMPREPIRSLGVRGCNLTPYNFTQLSFHPSVEEIQKHEQAEEAIQKLRDRFGPKIVQRCLMHTDKTLSRVSPREEHVIHPVALLR